jgi:hypothetical protein
LGLHGLLRETLAFAFLLDLPRAYVLI